MVKTKIFIISIIISFLIGVIGTGTGFYFYSESRIKQYKDVIAKAKQSLIDTQGQLQTAREYSQGLELRLKKIEGGLDNSIKHTAELDTLIGNGIHGLDDIITINNELIRYINDIENGK
jgi:hypothetical protein